MMEQLAAKPQFQREPIICQADKNHRLELRGDLLIVVEKYRQTFLPLHTVRVGKRSAHRLTVMAGFWIFVALFAGLGIGLVVLAMASVVFGTNAMSGPPAILTMLMGSLTTLFALMLTTPLIVDDKSKTEIHHGDTGFRIRVSQIVGVDPTLDELLDEVERRAPNARPVHANEEKRLEFLLGSEKLPKYIPTVCAAIMGILGPIQIVDTTSSTTVWTFDSVWTLAAGVIWTVSAYVYITILYYQRRTYTHRNRVLNEYFGESNLPALRSAILAPDANATVDALHENLALALYTRDFKAAGEYRSRLADGAIQGNYGLDFKTNLTVDDLKLLDELANA